MVNPQLVKVKIFVTDGSWKNFLAKKILTQFGNAGNIPKKIDHHHQRQQNQIINRDSILKFN